MTGAPTSHSELPTSSCIPRYNRHHTILLDGRNEATMLKYIPWNSVELETLNPLLQRQFVVGQDIMLARVLLKKGSVVPRHSHINEQITYILEGALKFSIDDKEIIVRAGEVLCIPPNMPHE